MTRIGKIFAVFIATTLQNWAVESFAQGGPPPAPPVVVAKPIAKRIVQWDEYTGRFEPVAQVEVRARVSGFVDQVHFRDGQIVRQGDLLFTIDKRPYELAVEAAAAEVQRARAQVSLAENEVERAEGLTRNQTITARDVDTRRSNLSVARPLDLMALPAGAAEATILRIEQDDVYFNELSRRWSAALVSAAATMPDPWFMDEGRSCPLPRPVATLRAL